MAAGTMFDFPFMGWSRPFSEIERMARQLDHLTDSVFGRPERRLFSPRMFPAINITEDKDKYYVRAELPGIKADEIQLDINGRNLAISGERKIQSEGQQVRYHRREREAGRFSRVIGLPGEVDADRVDAKLVNGLLTVGVAKSQAVTPKQITIN